MNDDEIYFVFDSDFSEYEADVGAVLEAYRERGSAVMTFSDRPGEEPTAFAAVFAHPYPEAEVKKTTGEGVVAKFTKHFVGVASCPFVYEPLSYVMDEAERRLRE